MLSKWIAQAPPRPGQPVPAHHFQGSLNWLSIEDDAAFAGEPGWPITHADRQGAISLVRLFEDADDLRQGVATFIQTYNDERLIERLGDRTPTEAFNEAIAEKGHVIVRASNEPGPQHAPATVFHHRRPMFIGRHFQRKAQGQDWVLLGRCFTHKNGLDPADEDASV